MFVSRRAPSSSSTTASTIGGSRPGAGRCETTALTTRPVPAAASSATSGEPHSGQPANGGKVALPQARQRWMSSSPRRVPSQNPAVSGVGAGSGRPALTR